MTDANTFVDPREDVDFEIGPGMVFHDMRYDDGRELVVEYADRDGGVRYVDTSGDVDNDVVYRFDDYATFEENVGAGRYTPVRDDTDEIVRKGWMGQIHRLKAQYEETDGRTAAHKAEAIEEVLEIITEDVPDDHNETVPFEDIDGIGQQAASALRNNGFATKGDVRAAGREQIESVPYMGEKNTDNLLEYIQ